MHEDSKKHETPTDANNVLAAGLSFEVISAFMKEKFINYANSDKRHSKDKNGEYYWKWISTAEIAKHFKTTTSVVRSIMQKAEQKKLVEGKKFGNWIQWYFPIEGFKRHPDYYDYVVRS